MTPPDQPSSPLGQRMADPALREELKIRVHARLMETLDLVQDQKLDEETLRHECLRRVETLDRKSVV